MLNYIKRLFKGCEHKWIVNYQEFYNDDELYCFEYKIYRQCSRCGNGIIIMSHKFKERKQLHEELFKKLKVIKAQNPDYYIIGIDD